MIVHEQDPDVVRWGLHTLIDVCAIRSNGSCSGVTQYEADQGQVGYVSEFYNEPTYINNIESDAVIARALQEELSHVAAAEASGQLDAGQDSILAQDWSSPSKNWKSYDLEDGQRMGDDDNKNKTAIPHSMQNEADGFSHKKAEESDQVPVSASPSFRQQNYPSMEESPYDIDIADEHDEYALDGEVGKRINQMVPIPHVPKINGEIPTLDEEVSDHQRLLDRLKVYFLVENKVQGDGNCQVGSVHYQINYIAQVTTTYLSGNKLLIGSGEWGDHVTLQAAADSYGVKIFVLTSFKDTCYIEIIPHVERSKRIIYLSFWAEVHYNSIYPEGEIPINEEKKKKKWWKHLLSS
ncbi:OVARIAN TUMOR DOMAIN-containing deubiquitinating enzyme 9 [Linum perenne]